MFAGCAAQKAGGSTRGGVLAKQLVAGGGALVFGTAKPPQTVLWENPVHHCCGVGPPPPRPVLASRLKNPAASTPVTSTTRVAECDRGFMAGYLFPMHTQPVARAAPISTAARSATLNVPASKLRTTVRCIAFGECASTHRPTDAS